MQLEQIATPNAEVLVGLAMAVIQGMSTLARDGASRHKLLLMADAFMKVWPEAGDGKQRIFECPIPVRRMFRPSIFQLPLSVR